MPADLGGERFVFPLHRQRQGAVGHLDGCGVLTAGRQGRRKRVEE